MSAFIEFIETAPPSDKTRRWIVKPVQSEGLLGTIKWYAPWRRYCFFPLQDTIYDRGCLEAIAGFIEARMRER